MTGTPASRPRSTRCSGLLASELSDLRSGAQGILALDFFTAGLLNGAKVYVLAVIEHGTRRVRVLGATEHPVQAWVVQQARNLLMDLEDAGTRVKFVLHDLCVPRILSTALTSGVALPAVRP